MKRVRAAVVGCGAISATYIPNLQEFFSILDITAVSGLHIESAKKAAEKYNIPNAMTLDEIADSEDIEMVLNLTPPESHYSVSKKMLQAGKHVFSEKPMAATVEQARELLELAKEKKLLFGCAPDTVLGAGIQTAKMILDAGLIGRPTSVSAVIGRDHSLNSELFRFLRNDEASSFPLDVGIYYVSAILCLLGPVDTVNGFSMKASKHHRVLTADEENTENQWEMPGNDLMAGALKFRSGVLGTLMFDGSSVNTSEHWLAIYGKAGILKLGMADRFDASVTLIRKESGQCEIPFTHGFQSLPNRPDTSGRLGWRGVGAAEMAWAIREKRPNRLSGEFALHTLEVLRGIEQASETGTPIRLSGDFQMPGLKSGYMDTIFTGAAEISAERSLCEKDEE